MGGGGAWGAGGVEGAGGGRPSDFVELLEVGLQDLAFEDEAGEFAFADDGDEAGGFEFLDVVGESGGGDGLAGADVGALDALGAGADLFQDVVAARVGEGFGDEARLAFREGLWFGSWRHVGLLYGEEATGGAVGCGDAVHLRDNGVVSGGEAGGNLDVELIELREGGHEAAEGDGGRRAANGNGVGRGDSADGGGELGDGDFRIRWSETSAVEHDGFSGTGGRGGGGSGGKESGLAEEGAVGVSGGEVFAVEGEESRAHGREGGDGGLAGLAIVGDLDDDGPGGCVFWREDVDLRGADIGDVGGFVVDGDGDAVEGSGKVAVGDVGARPGAGSGGEISAANGGPGAGGDAGLETGAVDDGGGGGKLRFPGRASGGDVEDGGIDVVAGGFLVIAVGGVGGDIEFDIAAAGGGRPFDIEGNGTGRTEARAGFGMCGVEDSGAGRARLDAATGADDIGVGIENIEVARLEIGGIGGEAGGQLEAPALLAWIGDLDLEVLGDAG